MITHATKTLIGVVIFLFSITLWVTFSISGTRSTDGLPDSFFDLDIDDVSRIEVTNHLDSSSIEIVYSGGSWQVASTNNIPYEYYPADRITIENFIKSMQNAKFESVVTRKSDNFSRYNVTEDLGTTVKFFSLDNNGNPHMSFIVGSSFNRRRDKGVYLRPLNDNNPTEVYGMLPLDRTEFAKTLLQWRDKLIWRINKNDITQLDFNFSPSDSSFSINKIGEDQWVILNDSVAIEKLNPLLNNLSTIYAEDFINADADEKRTTSITIHMTNGLVRELSLNNLNSDDVFIYAEAKLYGHPFRLKQSIWSKFLVGKTYYLESN